VRTLQFSKLNKKISERNNSLLILFGLICIGFALRLHYIPYQIPIDFDGMDYFTYTVAMSREGYFPIGYLQLNFGWSTFLAPIFSIVPSNEMLELMNVQRIMSSIISVLTAIPIYFICKIFFKKNIAILGAVLFLFDPRIIENSVLGITDPLFIFFITLTIMFLFIKESKFFYLSFIFVALAGFTRYEGLLLIIPLVISFFLRKNFKKLTIIKFGIGIILFISIIGFINSTAYENSSLDITSPLFSGTTFISNHVLSDNPNTVDKVLYVDAENRTQLFSSTAIITYLMYLCWIMIPILGLFIIPGVFLTKKKITKNKITFVIFLGFISLAPLYAYGRGIEETRYLYPLIPILILFSCQFFDYISKKWNIKIITIIVILISIILSIVFLEYNKEDYGYEEAIYDASYFVIKNAEGVNDYEGGNLRTAALENSWPELPPMDERMEMIKPVKKIQSYEYDSLTQYLKNNENNKLTHLVIPENHKTPFLKEVFHNEINYPFLKNVYNSQENGFNNEIKIFEINYERFYETEIVKLR
jgi:hypothetical protein